MWVIHLSAQFSGLFWSQGLLGGSNGKVSACNAGDPGSILGWEDPLEKEMATHSSTLAWKSPWTEDPGRLQYMGSQRVGHDWETSLHFWSQQNLGGCGGAVGGTHGRTCINWKSQEEKEAKQNWTALKYQVWGAFSFQVLFIAYSFQLHKNPG